MAILECNSSRVRIRWSAESCLALCSARELDLSSSRPFGRPYAEGWSTVNGFSAYATRGPWVAYVRGEGQSAPSIPAYSLTTRQTIQQVDSYPQLPPGAPQPSVVQFSLLDAYVGLMLSNYQISFGKQSLSWGPGDSGSMDTSVNTPPVHMF